ncbi:MAG: HAD-IC family P-type ATPase, partial [Candidatus Methanomethylicia archaeon]
CAIGLASPLAINKGMLETSKRKIIVKDPYVFEKISKSVNFVFDKTGTITNKNLSVNRIKILLNNSEDDSFWQELTLLTVSKSKHPISLAIKEYLQNSFKANLSKASTKYTLQNFKELTSQGLIAQFDKLVVILGNKSLISENILNIENFDNNLLEDYDTFILILEDKTENKDVLVFIGIEYLEQLNEDIEDVFRIIEKKGSNIYILTGAGEKSALKLTQQIKIEPQKIIHSVDAVKKTEVINNIKSKGLTVFVGDGLNDSLVMNTADVGISFEYGSDITQNSASVILKNISQLKDLIVISQEVFKKLKFNLVWVFAYNVLFIPVAMGIFSGWGITISPILAAIAMVLSDFSLLFFNLTNLLPVKSK